MPDMTITITGLDALVTRLKGADPIIEAELTRAMHEATLTVEAGMKSHLEDKRDTGMLFRSPVSDVTPLGVGGVRGLVGILRGPATQYARPVDEGRRAGAAPPPTAAIAAWLKRRGRDPKLAFVVARAIGRRGIPAHPFAKPAFEESRDKIRQAFEVARDRIVARLGGGA